MTEIHSQVSLASEPDDTMQARARSMLEYRLTQEIQKRTVVKHFGPKFTDAAQEVQKPLMIKHFGPTFEDAYTTDEGVEMPAIWLMAATTEAPEQ